VFNTNRLGTATCVAGGTIQQLLRASTSSKSVPRGDLLLAATLSARAAAPHFSVTSRERAQRREGLIRQPQDARPYMQQAAALQGLAQRARTASVLCDLADGAPRATVVHNVRDSAASCRSEAPEGVPAAAAAATTGGAAGGNWFFNLALQSSML
jgi:hypothetical protein